MQKMIKWRLHEVMSERRMKNIELARELGVAPNTISRLRVATRMPRLDEDRLESLCLALECQPGDLLLLAPDKTP